MACPSAAFVCKTKGRQVATGSGIGSSAPPWLVLVLDAHADRVGHRSKSVVGVPRNALVFAGRVLELAQVYERIRLGARHSVTPTRHPRATHKEQLLRRLGLAPRGLQ